MQWLNRIDTAGDGIYKLEDMAEKNYACSTEKWKISKGLRHAGWKEKLQYTSNQIFFYGHYRNIGREATFKEVRAEIFFPHDC